MTSKAAQQRKHAKRRARQRFGIILTQNDEAIIKQKIQNCEAIFIYKQSNRVSHFGIKFQGKDMIVIYDKIHKTIVTFLYPEKYDWSNIDERVRSRFTHST